MRNKIVQMSIEDIYGGVLEKVEEQTLEILALFDVHIDFEELVSIEFRYVFYSNVGRNHKHHLVSLIKLFVFQKLDIQTDKLTLIILKLSRELWGFCGFETVPDASLLSRFRERFSIWKRYLKKSGNERTHLSGDRQREILVSDL